MAQKSIQGNFLKILEKAINDKFTGSLVFLGPNGGIVRVVLIDGNVKHIDSTWGYGKSEIEKIKIWAQGSCLVKTLTNKDKETFSKMSNIELDIFPKPEKEKAPTKPTIKVETIKTTKLLPYRILDGGIDTFDEILSDIQQAGISGFLKVKPSNNILLFYKGRILQGFVDFPPSQRLKNYYILKQVMDNNNQILVYNLENEIAYSIITLFINKIMISGLDGSNINFFDIIEDCKINLFNGIVWIDGNIRILLDFVNGEIMHILKLDEVIRYIELPTSLDLKFSKIYKFGKIPEGDLLKSALKIPSKEEFEEFFKKWYKLNNEIVNKVGKKVVQKVFEKVIKDSDYIDLFQVKDGILKLVSSEKNSYVLFAALIEIVSVALNDLRTFIGGDWLDERLKKFYNDEKEIIELLGVGEVLKSSWNI
ncbi:MAG: hypothetical protein RMJ38_02210 [candidate division WOR-3 bacterium]|nr:hypothetical protein [candidate division WOR-3 bacterium]MDW8150242.1 hypothetical protein [candidate division WOR-3 bacterium]